MAIPNPAAGRDDEGYQWNALYGIDSFDPTTGKQYYYWGNGSSYKLYAKLEHTKDVEMVCSSRDTGYQLRWRALCTFGYQANTTP